MNLVFSLHHGRPDADMLMSRQGSDGPVIPVHRTHSTYLLPKIFLLPTTASILSHSPSRPLFFRIINDLILFHGIYYGDYSIYHSDKPLTVLEKELKTFLSHSPPS